MRLDFTTVDQLCASVDQTENPAFIDLSAVDWIEAFALVYLAMFIRLRYQQGLNVRIQMPKNRKVQRHLQRQNFFERMFLKPSDGSPVPERLLSTTSIGDLVGIVATPELADETARHVKGVLLNNNVEVDAAAVELLVAELVDNFVQHAEPFTPAGVHRIGAFVMQLYPRKRRVSLGIADCGIGIRASLSSNPAYSHLADASHSLAAVEALKQGVTRRTSGSGGTGFTEVQDTIRDLRGTISLATGDGYVILSGSRQRYGQMAYDLNGVQIQADIPCGS